MATALMVLGVLSLALFAGIGLFWMWVLVDWVGGSYAGLRCRTRHALAARRRQLAEARAGALPGGVFSGDSGT